MKKSLFVSYSHDKDGFGNIVLPGVNPPRNQEEIRMLEKLLNDHHKFKAVIINWKVMEE